MYAKKWRQIDDTHIIKLPRQLRILGLPGIYPNMKVTELQRNSWQKQQHNEVCGMK